MPAVLMLFRMMKVGTALGWIGMISGRETPLFVIARWLPVWRDSLNPKCLKILIRIFGETGLIRATTAYAQAGTRSGTRFW